MRTSLAILVACLVFVPRTNADNKKKVMIVTVSDHVQQINNHPWQYTTPGKSNTNCDTNGTVTGTATTYGSTTDINGQVYGTTTTTTPPQTTSGNRITVNNSAWLTDVATGDQYLIECTANWVGSKCSNLIGQRYKATLDGNNIIITGTKGMKEVNVKYHVRQFLPSQASPQSQEATIPAASATKAPKGWTEEEKFTWNWYNSLPDDDKAYVHDFCTANPFDRALLPHSKVLAGGSADRALTCSAWVSAKSKL